MSSVIRGDDSFDSGYMLGVGQTWQDMTSQRQVGVEYINDTGKPINVNISASTNGNVYIILYVDGIVVHRFYISSSGSTEHSTLTAVVPSGSTYMLNSDSAVFLWAELR